MSSPAAALAPPLSAALDAVSPVDARGSRFLRTLLVALDAATLLVAWLIAEAIWRAPHRSLLVTGTAVVLFPAAGVVLFGALGLYRARVCSLRSIECARLARACLLLALGGLAAVALLHGLVTNREIVLGAVLSLVLSLVSRAGYRNWLGARRREGAYLRRVLVVGAGVESQGLISLLDTHPELGYEPVGVVGDPEAAQAFDQPWCGDFDDVETALAATAATGAIVCATALDSPTLNQVVQQLLEARAHVQLSSGLRGVHMHRLRPLPLAHEPLFYVEPVSLAKWQLTLKRILDLAVSSAALIATAPILALAAIAIYAEDRGPVFFRQIRVGRDGERFAIYKLRTMRVGAESQLAGLRELNDRDGPLLKISDDPRVSRLGRILRATSVDELPQLWNVLNGTMSLVGPRPALPDEVAKFDTEHRAREDVRPGITGMWQVEGRDNPSFSAYRRFDLFYIQNWSVGLDLMILARTVEVLVARIVHTVLRRADDIQLARADHPAAAKRELGPTTTGPVAAMPRRLAARRETFEPV